MSCLLSLIILESFLSFFSTLGKKTSKGITSLLFQTFSVNEGSLFLNTGISASPACSHEQNWPPMTRGVSSNWIGFLEAGAL